MSKTLESGAKHSVRWRRCAHIGYCSSYVAVVAVVTCEGRMTITIEYCTV